MSNMIIDRALAVIGNIYQRKEVTCSLAPVVTGGEIRATKRFGYVMLRIDVELNQLTARTVIGYLPEGYRPYYGQIYFKTTAGLMGWIESNGEISIQETGASHQWATTSFLIAGD